MTREGNAWGVPLRITKALTLEEGDPRLFVAYLIEGLPRERQMHLALEWNFAGMPAGADDRFFYDEKGARLGELGTRLNLVGASHLGLIDQWQGLDVFMSQNRPASLWTFPIQTVSQSEAGFELVHQSVCVMPHWLIQGDSEGKWSVQMEIRIVRSHHPSTDSNRLGQSVSLAI
ncbi:MAG: alpha-amylase/4-alpha-glucanotransferase domain-containing protein [Pirellulales bacterium]